MTDSTIKPIFDFTDFGTTAMPNALVERMGRFRDTEYRLITLILRQTWGWHKEQDWLTHRRMTTVTGRGSRAITRAISALVGAGLIIVRNGAGEILATPAERRREHTGLYFSLHPTLTAAFLDHGALRLHSEFVVLANDKRKERMRTNDAVVDRQNDQPNMPVGEVVGHDDDADGRSEGDDGGDDQRGGHLDLSKASRDDDQIHGNGDSESKGELAKGQSERSFLRNPKLRSNWHRLRSLLHGHRFDEVEDLRWF